MGMMNAAKRRKMMEGCECKCGEKRDAEIQQLKEWNHIWKEGARSIRKERNAQWEYVEDIEMLIVSFLNLVQDAASAAWGIRAVFGMIHEDWPGYERNVDRSRLRECVAHMRDVLKPDGLKKRFGVKF